jgi:O-antigen/teichoic acid export membrane protein
MRVLAMGLNFAVQLVMARVMGLSDFGVASTALALLNVVVIPAALGYETAAIRFVALSRDDRPHLRTLTLHFARNVVVASAFTCLLLGLAATVAQQQGDGRQAIALAFLVAIVPCFAFVRVGEGWLRGFGALVQALVNSGVVVPSLTIAVIAAEWLLSGGGDVGVGAALGARALATAMAVLTVGFFLSGKLGRRLRPRLPLPRPVAADLRRTAMVLCVVGFLTMAVSQIDVLAVALFEGPAQAGLYSASSRIAQAMSVALVAVNFVLAPRVARLFAAGDRQRLQREVSSAASWCLGLMAAASLVLIPAAPLVLHAFGPEFSAAADALRILMVGQLVNAFCGPVGTLLVMTGRQWQAARVLTIAVVVDVVLFAVLIPVLGLNGAAIATTTCTACWNFGMLIYARRQLGVWSLPGAVTRFLAP